MNDTVTAVRIGPAYPSDADALTALVRSSDAYAGRYRAMVANQRLDAAYLSANVVRVARGAADEPHGFYSLLVPGRGSEAEAEGELDFMFVANGLQGRGIGRTMMTDLSAVAARLRLTRVHVVAHPPAERFYLRCGAQRVGQVPPAGRVTWSRPHLVLGRRICLYSPDPPADDLATEPRHAIDHDELFAEVRRCCSTVDRRR